MSLRLWERLKDRNRIPHHSPTTGAPVSPRLQSSISNSHLLLLSPCLYTLPPPTLTGLGERGGPWRSVLLRLLHDTRNSIHFLISGHIILMGLTGLGNCSAGVRRRVKCSPPRGRGTTVSVRRCSFHRAGLNAQRFILPHFRALKPCSCLKLTAGKINFFKLKKLGETIAFPRLWPENDKDHSHCLNYVFKTI